MQGKNKAIVLMIVSAIGFAVMGTFVKLAGNLPAIEKSLFRNIVSWIVAFYLVKKSGDPLFGKNENLKYLIGRALLGTIGIIANFYAIEHLILADANMLNQLSPFFTIIFSSLFLREKITKNQVIILITAFIGSLFIIRPTFSLEIIPALIGLSSAIFAGGAYTFVRFLGGKEKGPTIVFFFSFFSTITTLPFVLANFKPITMIQLFFLLMAGVAASVAQFALTAAYKYAPAKEISIYSYTQIVFTAIIGFLLFAQIPTMLSFIGYAIVITASIGMFIYNNKQAQSVAK